MRNPSGFEFYPGRRLPAVCRDGVTRQAVCTGYAGHGLPAAVQVYAGEKRRTVSGFISPRLWQGGRGYSQFEFTATGANAGFIPWTAHKPRLAAAALRLIKATAYGRGAPGYIWDFPSDHSAALAGGCRHYYGTSEWPQGGFAARALLKRLPAELLPRLAAYFDRLSRFQSIGEETRPSTPPPPPPVA